MTKLRSVLLRALTKKELLKVLSSPFKLKDFARDIFYKVNPPTEIEPEPDALQKMMHVISQFCSAGNLMLLEKGFKIILTRSFPHLDNRVSGLGIDGIVALCRRRAARIVVELRLLKNEKDEDEEEGNEGLNDGTIDVYDIFEGPCPSLARLHGQQDI
jgi:hypothetical protein